MLEIPAYFFLGLWFILQFISASGSHAEAGGVAWWAHIGGFVFGMLCLKILLALPAAEAPDVVRRAAARRKTPHLQVIRPIGPGPDPNLYATIDITTHEAVAGTYKLINIPWGFHKRLFRVAVPAGVQEGHKLRLRGLGKQSTTGEQGALYLKVKIR